MCFELAKRIMERIGDSVAITDDDQDFRHFQDRDLIDFVDGIDNPRAAGAVEAALVGAEGAALIGGSYIVVQKYLHETKEWNALFDRRAGTNHWTQEAV